MKIVNPTIGSDFELPAINIETGKPTSVIGKFKGTKAKPHPIGEGCFYQVDNVNTE